MWYAFAGSRLLRLLRWLYELARFDVGRKGRGTGVVDREKGEIGRISLFLMQTMQVE